VERAVKISEEQQKREEKTGESQMRLPRQVDVI